MFRLLPFGGDQRFNPRTRTGCDRARLEAQPEIVRVSTHAPARGATSVRVRLPRAFQVSTHAPARGATQIVAGHPFRFLFQPTHPHGVRRRRILRVRVELLFQPTHPHGVRHASSGIRPKTHQVSTHAPARGATLIKKLLLPFACVSTHAPARGATRHDAVRRGVSTVSTHAPARGATDWRAGLIAATIAFQPTHPHGVRPAGS